MSKKKEEKPEKDNKRQMIEVPRNKAIIMAALAKWTAAWLEEDGKPIGAYFKQSEIDAPDDRIDPKPRKLTRLWQAYQTWHEFMELRKAHKLRALSILRGKSNMDVVFEAEVIAVSEQLRDTYRKAMVKAAEETVGEIWEVLTSIRGLGEGNLAAQLLAQIDDISRFDSVAKLWRYSVGGVTDEGRMERAKKGEKSMVNKDMAALGYNISDQFVRQRTYPYRDFYDQEKARLRDIHPEPVDAIKKGEGKNVPSKYPWPKLYTDSHVDRMARRATFKRFLRDVWVAWRKIEGLSISEPWDGSMKKTAEDGHVARGIQDRSAVSDKKKKKA
jgi:hypothetical protein